MTSQTPDMQAVLERLENLERQNRRLKRVGLAAAILASSLVMMSQASPNRTVEAQEFILKDAGGRVRGVLTAKTGAPRLELRDANGIQAATLGSTSNGATLSLNDPNGGAAVALGVTGYARGLSLYDANSQRRAEFNLEQEGPALSFFRTTGEPVVALDGKGERGLSVYDGSGKLRIAVALWTPVRPSRLYRSCGKRDAGPDHTGGRSTLTFYDAEGNCEYSVP